jgi:oxygen-independent coproporphyrinogen-3 oxidase
MKTEISLYVHIPFCNSKCSYCAFVSKVGTDEEKASYTKDLLSEIKLRAKEYSEYFTVKSIFIGGGTPSCLNNYEIRDILDCIYKSFSVKNNAEITIEVNPNSLTKTKIREYILAGVNRFSIGLQTTSDKLLASMGRTHSLADFDNVVKDLRDQGMSNINADLIVGFPGQTQKDLEDAIKHMLNLKIPHLSCYMLQVEDRTRLKTLVDRGLLQPLSDETVADMYSYMARTLKNAGYVRYELSNFALPGFASIHNQTYWNRTEYLGFGVSAHSYVAGVRFSNTESISQYHNMLAVENKPPVVMAKELTKEEKEEETIMLSLRTANGLDTKAYEAEFGESLLASKKDKLAMLIKTGFLTLDTMGVIKVTDKGFLVLNRIIYELV